MGDICGSPFLLHPLETGFSVSRNVQGTEEDERDWTTVEVFKVKVCILTFVGGFVTYTLMTVENGRNFLWF